MNLHHQAAERGREYEDPHHQTKMTDNSLSATFLNSKASNYVIARQDLNKFKGDTTRPGGQPMPTAAASMLTFFASKTQNG